MQNLKDLMENVTIDSPDARFERHLSQTKREPSVEKEGSIIIEKRMRSHSEDLLQPAKKAR